MLVVCLNSLHARHILESALLEGSVLQGAKGVCHRKLALGLIRCVEGQARLFDMHAEPWLATWRS